MITLCCYDFKHFRCQLVSVGFERRTAVSVFLINASDLQSLSSLDIVQTPQPPNEKYSAPWNTSVRSAQSALVPGLQSRGDGRWHWVVVWQKVLGRTLAAGQVCVPYHVMRLKDTKNWGYALSLTTAPCQSYKFSDWRVTSWLAASHASHITLPSVPALSWT